jgi:hypothetical protein
MARENPDCFDSSDPLRGLPADAVARLALAPWLHPDYVAAGPEPYCEAAHAAILAGDPEESFRIVEECMAAHLATLQQKAARRLVEARN